MMKSRALAKSIAALASALALVICASRSAVAAPQAKILRIDPRASTTDGAPVLTTLVEITQTKRVSDITGTCTAETGGQLNNAFYDCVGSKLDQPGALFQSFDFFDKNAIFSTVYDGSESLAKFVSKARWGDVQGQPAIGTAWLILVDASASMGPRFDEAKAIASAFINAMGPGDIVDVMSFDRTVLQDSKWKSSKADATSFVASLSRVGALGGRTRPLGSTLKQAITDGFGDLGNVGNNVQVPLHQALVVLSNGQSGADTTGNAAFALQISRYATAGRFPEDNQLRPKAPVPIVSIWLPSPQIEELGANAREFMEGLANPEIGGYYNIVRDGQAGRAPNIVNAVRSRFNKMHVVKWRVSCIAPTVLQSFRLYFANIEPMVAGENWDSVPVGIDPSTWPLDIDREQTERAAKKDPIYPGGKVRIFGDFCWGGQANRAELYMVPKNQQTVDTTKNRSIEEAKKARDNITAQGLRGKVVETGDGFVEFELPASDKWLVGSGDKMIGRMVVYDNVAKRASPVTTERILTLAARTAPLPILWIGVGTFAGVVLILLVVTAVRGGGGSRRKTNAAPAAPPPPRPMGGAPPMAPPADFIAAPPPPNATRATIQGAAGIFTVRPGEEMRAGRDGQRCQIFLAEPRVSGYHATLKFENGQLFARDENSNNGTSVNGQRIAGGVWTPVSHGASLRFGPVEFTIRYE